MLQTKYDIDKYDVTNMAWTPIDHANNSNEAMVKFTNISVELKKGEKVRIRQKNDGIKKFNKIIKTYEK